MRRHFVASAFVVQGGKVLLVLHRKIGLWLPAGGHIEPNEDPAQAVLREVREETGLRVRFLAPPDAAGTSRGVRILPSPHHLQIEHIAEGPHEHIDLVYVCGVRSGRLRKNAESTDVRWFDPEELEGLPDLDENTRYFARQVLEEYSDEESE